MRLGRVETKTLSRQLTDLNHPCITKVKEVITSEKSTTIVMEYVRIDEKLKEKFMTITIFSQKG